MSGGYINRPKTGVRAREHVLITIAIKGIVTASTCNDCDDLIHDLKQYLGNNAIFITTIGEDTPPSRVFKSKKKAAKK